MVTNNRTFYASQGLLLKPQRTAGDGSTSIGANWKSPKGIQSVGITTNFALSQVFQMGQIELYDRVEEVPEIQVTINKVIDGTCPLYLLCMGGEDTVSTNSGASLVSIANNRVNVRLGIFSDTNSAATGSPRTYVDMSGMYLSAFTYTFPVDGNMTEEVTLVGNNKVWNSGILGGAPTYSASGNGLSFGITGAGSSPNTMIRSNLSLTSSGTLLPTGVGGIPNASGAASGVTQLPHVQSITISSTLGREAIKELGRFTPYYRYVNFPLEITSEFTIIGTDGDNIEARDFSEGLECGAGAHNGIYGYRNLLEKAVKVVVVGTGCNDLLILDLGTKNKLTSVNYSGADTGGGNATVAYSFSTFNTFTLSASGTFTDNKYIDLVDDAGYDD